MDKRITIAAVIALAIGLSGGASATFYWFHARERLSAKSNAEDREHSASAHNEHGERDEGRGPERVRLTREAIEQAGIRVAQATGGKLERVLSLPGEVVVNADKLAHIVPRVSGIVRDVRKGLGDEVRPGEVMAVLESRELAAAKATYLAAKQRLSLARASLAANEELRAKGIVPDLEFLAVQRELAEAEIDLRTAEHRLHSLGVTEEQVAKISNEDDQTFSLYELRAPFAGTVIDKHITLGEVADLDSNVFVLADLSTVWVNLTVYQKDLASVRVGQAVVVSAGHGVPKASGTIDYVSPIVEEATRTATARAVLANPDGRWRPGLFVTGHVRFETVDVPLLVPKESVQTVDGKTCVFVQTSEGFEPRPVSVGRSDGVHLEITEGLTPGERYVSVNAFALKSELGKAGFEAGHAH